MTTANCRRSEGERRKLAALSLLAARREALIRRGRRALLMAMLHGDGWGSADDVRLAVTLPEGANPEAFGAVPSGLAELGIIGPDGFTKSGRPEAHARPIQRWRLLDRDAALYWLAAHPDLPEPLAPGIQPKLFGEARP